MIVKLGALGDVLRTTTCLTPLKERYPASHITWITRRNAVPLLESNPLVDRVLAVEDNYMETILVEQFDLAIGPETDQLSALIMRGMRAGTKRGYIAAERGGVIPLSDAAHEWWLMGLDDARKQANRRTYGEWLYDICELSGPVARPLLHVSGSAHDAVTKRLDLSWQRASQRVAFNTGGSARWAQKRWNPEYYPQLAQHVISNDPGASVLLVGGPDERTLNQRLRGDYPAFVDGGSAQSMEEFAATIAAADWVLTGDSLCYHVACAVGTPALCLVGPTSPWKFDTYGTNAIVNPALDCIACYHAKCPLSVTCMDVMTPDVVWEHVRQWRAMTSKGATLMPMPANVATKPRMLPVLASMPLARQVG